MADGSVQVDELSPGDRMRVDRLVATCSDGFTLTARIKKLDQKIPALLERLGSTLTTIHGIGVVNAMDLMVEICDPCRFATEAQFARWCGAAPVAVASGEGALAPRRHRLDLGGNRNANSILHSVHVTQIRCHPPAKTYMERRAEHHKPRRAASRSHKRHLANVTIRHIWKDVERLAAATNDPLDRAA